MDNKTIIPNTTDDVPNRPWQFQPGNKETAKRRHNFGGRPASALTSIKQSLVEHPRRARELLDNLYKLAMGAKDEKTRLEATRDYLDRIGFRMPKESKLTVQGAIMVGGPEEYRRAAMLLDFDKAGDAAMAVELSMPSVQGESSEVTTREPGGIPFSENSPFLGGTLPEKIIDFPEDEST